MIFTARMSGTHQRPTASPPPPARPTSQARRPIVALLVKMGFRHGAAAPGALEAMEDVIAPAAAWTDGQPLPDWLSPVFLFVGSFYGWWACLVWSVVACSTLVVYRLGLNSGESQW